MKNVYDTSIIYITDTGDMLRKPPNYIYRRKPTDEVYEVKQGQTLHSISLMRYGDTRYWSVIAIVNHIIDPFSDLGGKQIIIPS